VQRIPIRFQPTYEGLKPYTVLLKPRMLEPFPAYLRGIETGKGNSYLYAPGEFPAYLRGIETFSQGHAPRASSAFPAYLRGIETQLAVLWGGCISAFPAYLRGIETTASGSKM